MTGTASRAPLAYLWGDDLWSLEAAASSVAARIGDPAAPPEQWRVAGSATSVAELAERVGTATLFGGGTVVVVLEPGPLVRSAKDREALRSLFPAVAAGNGLVFVESVDGTTRRSVTLDSLREDVASAGGEVREIRAPREGQFAAWIEERARERDLRLAPGVAKLIAERVGGFVREGDVDRRRQGQLAVAEIDKLALLRPAGEASPDDVQALVPEAITGSTWALLDAVAMRRARVALELLDRVMASTPEPVLVVQLHRRLREVAEVAGRLDAGETPGSLVRSMKLKPFRAEKLVEQARAWSSSDLEAALGGLLALDVALKGAGNTVRTDAQRRLAFAVWIGDRVAPR